MDTANCSLDDIDRAAARLDGIAHVTPELTSRTLDARIGGRARLKAECPNVRLVLLLHEPSRDRVIRGLQLNADAMLGWPVAVDAVVEKIQSLNEPQVS